MRSRCDEVIEHIEQDTTAHKTPSKVDEGNEEEEGDTAVDKVAWKGKS